MRFGPDGDLYLTSTKTNQVLRMDVMTGDTSVFVASQSAGLDNPQDLLFGNDGNLYVSSATNEVLRYQGPAGASPGAPMGALVAAGVDGLAQSAQ